MAERPAQQIPHIPKVVVERVLIRIFTLRDIDFWDILWYNYIIEGA